ncbi:hypothetical protein ABB37_06445 [Leptomonas pyrrhocoris]|uniref:Uncharacterized protein n=1 Tax=Leptomonas pyrrhocoris TaxID=157538 RepID=A0A0N0VEG4_LEPPY|nr:hypothetical protein ABB37_06445 [Leptomonas pyrrhocoris]KPA78308.1 hypothetical protein ABB37_06445 [Leptomonas pyrrhocoris]|eukprot:XP_015656747.1 hypothetical protein ABB37_06445 [Leptomonas pyrrhocoris]
MSYKYQEEEEPTDPGIVALAANVQQLTGDISGPFRKGEFTMVLQQFDMLMAASAVEEVAARALDFRDEMRILDVLGSSLNVLDADFLHWRLTTPQGRMVGVEGNYALPRPSNVSVNAYQLFELEHRIEESWGQALLAAMRLMPDEQEHHEEIVNDFERLFERCSDYLRSLLQETSDAIHLLDVTVMDPTEVSAQYVVCAALLKHPPQEVETLVTLVSYMRQRSIPLSIAAAELMERIYVRFMKGPAVADVFKKVTAVGIIPLSARPFAMLFNNLTDSNAVLDAYDVMLDYGIAPEASTLRILCKQSRMEYAKLHFTTVLKNMATSTDGATAAAAAAMPVTATNSQSQTPSPSPPPRSPAPTSAGPAAAANSNSASSSAANVAPVPASVSAAAAAHAASRRRDERSYFAQRIQVMIEKDPNVSLLAALKVLHRAEVEGTTLQGDTYIMSALLRHYCRGITPRKYLVLPFTESLAYCPKHVADDGRRAAAAEAGAEDAVGGEEREGGSSKKFETVNAFAFGLDDTGDELLEEEGKSTINDESLQPLSGSAGRRGGGGDHDAGKGRRAQRAAPRDPYIADSSEEGDYILEVLKSYGSYPDNNVLQAISAQYEGRVPEMEIVAKAADAFFEGCMASQGTMEPVNCRVLHALGYYFIDNRWRDRAHQLLYKVLEMYHAYQVQFHADLGGTEKWFCYFAVIVGTKTGPLDLGIGLFTVALALGDKLINPKVPTKLTVKRDSSENVIEVIEELERCGWDRNTILCCDALMLEPQERAQAEGASEGDNSGASGSGGGGVYGLSEDLGKDSIYTSAAQGPSSFANAHLLSARPSLATYMYVALRELGVEKATMNWLRDKLKVARAEALATAAAATGSAAN